MSGVVGTGNPNLSATFRFPAKLIEVPSLRGARNNQTSRDGNELIVILTKNNPSRLMRTLPWYEGFSRDIVLLDDSISQVTRQLVKMKFDKTVRYHGRAEKTLLLEKLGIHDNAFVSPLGKRGWTLGYCRNYAVLLALAWGADYLLMIDDDIVIERGQTVDISFQLLRKYEAVGTRTVGMCDDSIVGHLSRQVVHAQYDYMTFQDAGLDLRSTAYYFPNVYNEDLVFYTFQGQGKQFARSGKVKQLTKRIEASIDATLVFQEQGELILLGTTESVNRGNEELMLDTNFWSKILKDRTAELRELEDLYSRRRLVDRRKVFKIIMKYHQRVKPIVFVSFYQKYRDGIKSWRSILTRVRDKGRMVEAVSY